MVWKKRENSRKGKAENEGERRGTAAEWKRRLAACLAQNGEGVAVFVKMRGDAVPRRSRNYLIFR
jgi:hypothetical protein